MPNTKESQTGKLNKKWLFLYLLGCVITTGICVIGSIAWWFQGEFLINLAICSMLFCVSVSLQGLAFTLNSKRVAQWVAGSSSNNFLQTLFRFLGSKVSVGTSLFLVGVSLILTGMLIWKSYSQFLGTWIVVTSVVFMIVMPLLRWTDRQFSSVTNKVRHR